MEVDNARNIDLKEVLLDSDVFNTLFNVLNIHLFAIDIEGRYIIKNKILDESVKKLFPNEITDNLNAKDIDQKSWAHCIHIIESLETEAIEEFAPNGHWYLSVKTPLLNNGKVIGVIGISIDITDKKQAEIAKRTFTENMSHDLRTPFAGILSVAEMLYRKEENASKKEWLGDIVVSSKWLLSIMNQTLEVISKGSNTLKPSEFNVHDVIKETIGLLQTEIHRKGLEVTSSCPDAIIVGDRTKLSRILINLLGNAVKYTEKGAISVKLDSVSPLQISIEDTGIGIPEDSLEIIFDQFTKLKPSNEQQTYSGAGVGLYLARSLANDLGGDIAVKSEVGQGSCFTLMLKN